MALLAAAARACACASASASASASAAASAGAGAGARGFWLVLRQGTREFDVVDLWTCGRAGEW